MKKLSVDRIEDNIAVCEGDDGGFFQIEIENLPKGCKEGDIILYDDTNNVYLYDKEETENRKENLYNLTKKLFKDNDKGER